MLGVGSAAASTGDAATATGGKLEGDWGGLAAPARPMGMGMTAEVKLACEGVWKLFGPGAGALSRAHRHRPQPADWPAAGLIGAVRDASLAIRTGEIFVIMGLSGSGKSTLVRCMSRLIEPRPAASCSRARTCSRLRARS